MSIIVAFLSIVASGVFATVISYRLNATKEHVFFMRQKAEALYMAFERYDRFLGSHFISYYAVIKNEITYNELLDLKIKDSEYVRNDSGVAITTATMLVNVYFPELKAVLEHYISVRDEINNILSLHKRNYKEGDVASAGARSFGPFHEAVQNLSQAGEALNRAILKSALELAPAEQLWPRSLTLRAVRARWRQMFVSGSD